MEDFGQLFIIKGFAFQMLNTEHAPHIPHPCYACECRANTKIINYFCYCNKDYFHGCK